MSLIWDGNRGDSKIEGHSLQLHSQCVGQGWGKKPNRFWSQQFYTKLQGRNHKTEGKEEKAKKESHGKKKKCQYYHNSNVIESLPWLSHHSKYFNTFNPSNNNRYYLSLLQMLPNKPSWYLVVQNDSHFIILTILRSGIQTGYSEHELSLSTRSGAAVQKNLNKVAFPSYIWLLGRDGWLPWNLGMTKTLVA